jgi:hypothetical protein
MEELNNNLKSIIDFSNNTFDPNDTNNQDLINNVAELKENLPRTDGYIKEYIIYPLEYYNTTLTSYIQKFKDIKGNIFILIRILNTMNIYDINKYNNEIDKYKKQVIIYGITANVNQNYDNKNL